MSHGFCFRIASMSAALASALSLATPAQAQDRMTPGLWETQVSMKNAQMDDAMAKMQAQMASMSPQQRQVVEQAMAGRGVAPPGQPHTVRTCITKEQAARASVPPGDGHCQQQETSRSGNSVKYSFTCTGEHPASGTGEFKLTSPTSYTMHSVSDATVQGKPQHVEMDVAGTWVAADCGSVKPVGAGAN